MGTQKHSLQDFLKIQYASGGQFSFNDSKIFYVSNASGTSQVYCMPSSGGEARQLTFFEDSISGGLIASGFLVSPKEDKVFCSINPNGSEKRQIYSVDVRSAEVLPLLVGEGDRYELGAISPDGKTLAYYSNKRNGTDFDIYLLDLASLESHCVFSLGGWCEPVRFSPSGKYLTILRNYLNDDNDIYLYDLENGECESLTGHVGAGKIFHGQINWLLDETGFFFVSDAGSDFKGLFKYDLGEKKTLKLLEKPWDLVNVKLSKDGKILALVYNEDGFLKLNLCDPETLTVLDYAFPSAQIGGINFSSDSKKMIYSLEDSRATANLFLLDLGTKNILQLTDSFQGVPKEELVDPELVRFSSFDGLEVSAFVYKPNSFLENQKLPVVINIHGGPESQYTPGFAPLSQYLVQNGFVVVAPNVRGSSGYGKKFLSLDDREKRMDSVRDIVSLREYLVQKYEFVDEDGFVVMGGSYGGFMVLACLAFFPELWAAGVDIVGVANFVTFLQNTADYRRAFREVEYGYLKTDLDFLKSISPINSADKITAPLMIIHGANDPRVPLSEAEQIFESITTRGGVVELLVYEDEGHGLGKLKNRLDAYPKVIEFLQKVLYAKKDSLGK